MNRRLSRLASALSPGPPGPFLYFGLLAILAFLPCILTNQFYYSDDITTYSILRQFLKEHLLKGEFPLWNPYLLGGSPFLAYPNTMAAYPLLYPFLLFSIPWGMSLFNLVHFFIAGMGAFFWLRKLGLKDGASRVGAMTYALSGIFWWEILHPPLLAALAWFPWFLAGLEGLCQEWIPGRAFKAGLSFAILFLCGSYQITLGALLAGGLYVLARLGNRNDLQNAWKNRNPGKWTRVFGALVWGGLPLLILFIPSYEYIRLSDRYQGALNFSTFNASHSLDPGTLYQVLYPVHPFGPPPRAEETFDANAGFAGLWTPLLVFWALRRKKHPLKWPLVLIGSFFFLVSLGKYFPLFHWLCLGFPGFHSVRASFRFIFVAVACFSVLAAWGYEQLENFGASPLAARNALLIYGTILLILTLLWPQPTWAEWIPLLLGLSGVVLWRLKLLPHPWGLRWFFVSILFSMLLPGWYACPSRMGAASNFDFTGKMPLFNRIKAEAGDSRILLEDGCLQYPTLSLGRITLSPYPVDATCLFGIRNVLGYSAMAYGKTNLLMAKTPVETWTSLFAVKGYLVKDKGNPGSLYPLMGFLRGTCPMVYAPAKLRIVEDDSQALSGMASKDFNPMSEAFLAGPLSAGNSLLKQKPVSLRYKCLAEWPNGETYDIQMSGDHLTVFSQVNYPGWKAWLDGKPAPNLEADTLFRALVIPAGRHRVEFLYRPWWYYPLPVGLAVWLLGTGVFRKRLWKS